MNKHYKIYNTVRNKTQVVTEKGLQGIQSMPSEASKIEVIGECDESGNLFEKITENNFLSKPIVKPVIEKKEKVTVEKIFLGEDGDPVNNISFQPTKEQLEKKIKEDLLAKETYEKEKSEKLKNVSNEKTRKSK